MTTRRLKATSNSSPRPTPIFASLRAASARPTARDVRSTIDPIHSSLRGSASFIIAGPAWLCVAVTITRAASSPCSFRIRARTAAVSSAVTIATSSCTNTTGSPPASKAAARA